MDLHNSTCWYKTRGIHKPIGKMRHEKKCRPSDNNSTCWYKTRGIHKPIIGKMRHEIKCRPSAIAMATASVCVYSWCTVACAVMMTVVFPAVVSVTAKSHSSQHQHISTGENKSFRLLFMTLMSVCVCSEVKVRILSKCSNIMRT